MRKLPECCGQCAVLGCFQPLPRTRQQCRPLMNNRVVQINKTDKTFIIILINATQKLSTIFLRRRRTMFALSKKPKGPVFMTFIPVTMRAIMKPLLVFVPGHTTFPIKALGDSSLENSKDFLLKTLDAYTATWRHIQTYKFTISLLKR